MAKTKILASLCVILLFLSQHIFSSINDYFPNPIGPSSSNYGNTGILEMPNARFMDEARMRFNFSGSFPYEYTSLTTSPFNWFEATYRYTEIKDEQYGPSIYSNNQSLKDKGFDVKFRIFKESLYMPSVAVGLNDIAGTGLFSSEYIVATKNYKDIDFTLGLGFGLLGNEGGISNPFRSLSENFKRRPAYTGLGGEFSFGTWFSGDASLFGGMEYDLKKYGLRLKLEYDTSNLDEIGKVDKVKSRFNIGATYHLSESLNLSASFERGDVFRVGFNLTGNFLEDTVGKPKPKNVIKLDKERADRLRRDKGTFYRSLNKSLQDEGIFIQAANYNENSVDVAVATERFFTFARTAGRTARIASALSDDEVEQLNIHVMNGDTEVVIFSLNREEFDKADKRIGSVNEILDSSHIKTANNNPLYKDAEFQPKVFFPDFKWTMAPSLRHQLGGPEGFYLGALIWQTDLIVKIRRNLTLYTSIGINVYDTFDDFKNFSESPIPKVRSDIQRYLDEGKNHIKRMNIEYHGSPFKNVFYRVDAGILEEMFAGIGGEILYRPFNRRYVLGLSAHKVRKRAFDQKFSLMDYENVTGHLSLYNEWPAGVVSSVSIGEYLAGDQGGTVDVSRRYKSGFTLGVYATKTNLSAEEFGEGSFDKGFYFSIPTKLFFTDYTTGHIGFGISPLTKDGGARLWQSTNLYGVFGDSHASSIMRDWDALLD